MVLMKLNCFGVPLRMSTAFDNRIVGLLGKLPILGRLVP
jgi:hypothetical protein